MLVLQLNLNNPQYLKIHIDILKKRLRITVKNS
jgi:hypothetical protein